MGKVSNLTNIFQDGLQPPTRKARLPDLTIVLYLLGFSGSDVRALRKRRWDDGPGEVQPTGEVLSAALPSSKRFMVQAGDFPTVFIVGGFRLKWRKGWRKGWVGIVFFGWERWLGVREREVIEWIALDGFVLRFWSYRLEPLVVQGHRVSLIRPTQTLGEYASNPFSFFVKAVLSWWNWGYAQENVLERFWFETSLALLFEAMLYLMSHEGLWV